MFPSDKLSSLCLFQASSGKTDPIITGDQLPQNPFLTSSSSPFFTFSFKIPVEDFHFKLRCSNRNHIYSQPPPPPPKTTLKTNSKLQTKVLRTLEIRQQSTVIPERLGAGWRGILKLLFRLNAWDPTQDPQHPWVEEIELATCGEQGGYITWGTVQQRSKVYNRRISKI